MGTVQIVIYKEGITFGNRYNFEEDRRTLSRLYVEHLDKLPINTDPLDLGLHAVLGIFPLPNKRAILEKHTQLVAQDHLVSWINYVLITHRLARTNNGDYSANTTAKHQIISEGYGNILRVVFGGYAGNLMEVVSIDEEMFPSIVEHLGKTIGIYALRRMLLSLLYYLKKNNNVRADLFVMSIEIYLEQHKKDKDDVIEFSVNENKE